MRNHLFPIPVITSLMLVACSEAVHDARQEASLPAIFPDYTGVTIPAGIAPLNFCMADRSAQKIDAVIMDSKGTLLHGQGKETTGFNIDEWHKIIAQHTGDSLLVQVSAKYDDGWHSYLPFTIYISKDEIDYGVVYRKLEPGYEVYSKMGIYERDLSTYKERALIENTQFSGCVNCHSFNQCDPTNLSLHIRGKHGATLLRLNGTMGAYNTATNKTIGSCVYPYWHPEGRYIMYSTNITQQVFHVRDANRIEVYDQASDLLLYDIQNNELVQNPLLAKDSVMETFPAFSADGSKLYFCQATALPSGSTDLQNLHYNLCSISFDAATGTFGTKIDTLLNAEALGRTATMPRPSYDGRFLMFTMADYGQFPIWHHEADLYMIPTEDLREPIADVEQYRMRAVNTDETESFHNWNSSSRWIVFSSRRDDGLFTKLYFSHIDENGNETKPFLLPQANPRRFYDELFMSYNVPDFITSPVKFDDIRAEELINSDERIQMKVR